MQRQCREQNWRQQTESAEALPATRNIENCKDVRSQAERLLTLIFLKDGFDTQTIPDRCVFSCKKVCEPWMVSDRIELRWTLLETFGNPFRFTVRRCHVNPLLNLFAESWLELPDKTTRAEWWTLIDVAMSPTVHLSPLVATKGCKKMTDNTVLGVYFTRWSSQIIEPPIRLK